MQHFQDGFSDDAFAALVREKWPSFISVRKEISCAGTAFASAGLLGVVGELPAAAGAASNAPFVVVSVALPAGVELGARSSRRRQFEFARRIIRHFSENPPAACPGTVAHGLFAFSDDGGNFRLSLVTSRYDRAARLAFSSFRRQSFYVARGGANATFRRYVLNRPARALGTLADVRAAFSVEALTREFYTEIEKWFLWARRNVSFPKPANARTTDEEHNSIQTLRLITRLIFVWFLKQKGLVPNELFDRAKVRELLNFSDATGSTYYKAILQNLFFATLNTPLDRRAWVARQAGRQEFFRYKRYFRSARTFEYLVEICGRVPFVNGGLFENLDGRGADGRPDEALRLDCFSNRRDNEGRLVVPDKLFLADGEIPAPGADGAREATTTGLLATLGRFDFTIAENAPDDEDVSLDPELLGRVFENLLAYVNPETSEQARKATGSFYTPREIVNYMVDEALKAYLGDAGKLSDRAFERKVKSVRVLDPACGSGAFPMGVLTRLVELLEERGILDADDGPAVYRTKLELIRNCLYGVDIQNIAVQITKLRFFISLLCEQRTTGDASANFGISVLPNLETKFVAANSLIAQTTRVTQGALFEDPALFETKEALRALRDGHFNARTPEEKRRIRAEDVRLRRKLAELLEKNTWGTPENAALLASWDPYDPNNSADFFNPETMFGVKDGFDIVIGNPPYVLVSADDALMAKYKAFYQLARSGKVNLYRLFFERSISLLHSQGTLSFITPNTYLTDKHGEQLRKMLSSMRLIEIIEYTEHDRVFESAAQAVATIICNKESTKDNVVRIRTAKQGQQLCLQSDLCSQDRGFIPLSGIIARLGKQFRKLSDYFEAYQGEINLTAKRDWYGTKRDKQTLPMWRGVNVGKYARVSEPVEYCRLSGIGREHYKQARIVLQQVSNQGQCFRTKAFLSPKNYICGNSTNYLVPKPDNTMELRCWLGIINSAVFNYYFNYFSFTNHITVSELATMPVPRIPPFKQSQLMELVDAIVEEKHQDPVADTSALEAKIDALVYRLYGLTADEIAVVEEASGARDASGAGDASEVGGEARVPALSAAAAAASDAGHSRGGDGRVSGRRRGAVVPAGYHPELDGEDE